MPPVSIIILSCQPRVTVTSCFVNKVIRDLYSIDHLCITYIINTQVIYRFASAQVEYTFKFKFYFDNCRQNIASLSLFVGTTVKPCTFFITFIYISAALVGGIAGGIVGLAVLIAVVVCLICYTG